MKGHYALTSNKLIGSFVFKDDGDGCLSSKYINVGMDEPLVEGCKLISPNPTEPFVGTYSTIWLDSRNTKKSATLVITKIITEPNTSSRFYVLKWTNRDNDLIFEGQGMFYQGLLIGSYWR